MGLIKHFDFKQGDSLGASSLNRIQHSLESLSKITVTPPLKLSSGPHGVNLSMAIPMLCKFGVPSATITARSGITPGYGDVVVWAIGGDDKFYATTDSVKCYNMSGSAISAGVYVIMIYLDGKWFAIFEDCSI